MPPFHHRRRSQAGFTLLEVVVAFAVLALTLSTAFQIFSTGLARAGELEERSQALALAQSMLSGVGVADPVQEGEARGETPDRHYRWLVKTARYEEPLPPAAPGSAAPPAPPQSIYGLYRVEVVVEWDAASAAKDLRLATVVLGPVPQ